MDYHFLQEKSRQIRRDTVACIADLGVGHIGGALSIVDILVVLYYGLMRVDPVNPKMEGRDRFVLSKGHGGPAVYAVLADKGYFPRELLGTLNRIGTRLPSHCDMHLTPGIDMTTGSLGQGFSAAVGVALGGRIKKENSFVYAVIGDGESQEGQIWVAAMLAGNRKMDNLIAFCDRNGCQIDGPVDEINSLGDLAAKWRAFGWDVQEIDGHDHEAIYNAAQRARGEGGRPHMIICDTVKGKGVSFVEEAGCGNHNMNISKEQYAQAMAELA
jgi:transketolase